MRPNALPIAALLLVGCEKELTSEQLIAQGEFAEKCFKALTVVKSLSGNDYPSIDSALTNSFDAAMDGPSLTSQETRRETLVYLAEAPIVLADTDEEKSKLLERNELSTQECIDKFR